MSTKVIIGIGNPGTEYEGTRHNTGYMFVDEILKKENSQFKAYKSDEFMNESGVFAKKIVDSRKLDLSDLYVVHDDLDIKLGEYKIQFGRGPKDHNGVRSVNDSLGTEEYWHIRIGVDNRPLDNRPLGIEYVLEKFDDEENEIIKRTIKEASGELIKKL